jgi:acylphosphatase
MPARRFVIRGLVQGVGFRYSMCEQATRLGLAGWVRNRRDGSVEAVAMGDAAALDALQRWAAHGPRGARVDVVDTTPLSADTPTVEIGSGFRQAPTV